MTSRSLMHFQGLFAVIRPCILSRPGRLSTLKCLLYKTWPCSLRFFSYLPLSLLSFSVSPYQFFPLLFIFIALSLSLPLFLHLSPILSTSFFSPSTFFHCLSFFFHSLPILFFISLLPSLSLQSIHSPSPPPASFRV